MFNIKFAEATVNCAYWCLDTLRIAGITDAKLKDEAEMLAKKAKNEPFKRPVRTTLIDVDWFQKTINEDMELLLEFAGTRKNDLTGKEENYFYFIKKRYGNSTFTYNSCEFTI